MSIKLELLAATNTLDELQTIIRQTEDLNFRLISISKGRVANQPGNILTLHRESVQDNEGRLGLEEIGGNVPLDQQEATLNQLESNGKRLLGYWSVFVQGSERNVAGFRA